MILRIESYRRGIAWSTGLGLVSQAIGFVSSLVFAYMFGTGAQADVYFYCVAVVGLAGGLLTSLGGAVIIPEAMRRREQESLESCMKFTNWFLYVFALIAGLAALVAARDPVGVFTAISRFDAALLADNASLVRWSVPLLLLQVLSQYLLDVLAMFKFFTLPMLFAMASRILLLAALLGLSSHLGVASALAALLISNLLQVILSLILLRRATGWRFDLCERRIPRVVATNCLLSTSGNIATTLAAGIPMMWLSGWPPGIISALNYAQRLAALPNQVVANQVASVAGIRLNELVSRREWARVDAMFGRTCELFVIMLGSLTAWCIVFGGEIVRLCFRRGLFTEESAAASTVFFRWLILGIVFYAINTLVARLFMAGQRVKSSFWFQILANVALLGVIYTLMNLMGSPGYPAAQSIMGLAYIIALAFLIRAQFPELHCGRTFLRCGALALLPVVWGVLLWCIRQSIPHGWMLALLLTSGAATGLVVLALLRWRSLASLSDFLPARTATV